MEEKEYIAKSAQISYLRMAFGLENYNLKITGIHVATYSLHVPKQGKATSLWNDLVKTTRKCKIWKRNAHQLAPIILLLHLDAEKLLITNDSVSTSSTMSQRLLVSKWLVSNDCSDAIQSLAAMMQMGAPSYDDLILMVILLLT